MTTRPETTGGSTSGDTTKQETSEPKDTTKPKNEASLHTSLKPMVNLITGGFDKNG